MIPVQKLVLTVDPSNLFLFVCLFVCGFGVFEVMKLAYDDGARTGLIKGVE